MLVKSAAVLLKYFIGTFVIPLVEKLLLLLAADPPVDYMRTNTLVPQLTSGLITLKLICSSDFTIGIDRVKDKSS